MTTKTIRGKSRKDKDERKNKELKNEKGWKSLSCKIIVSLPYKIISYVYSLPCKIIVMYILLNSILKSFIEHQLCGIRPGRSWGN